MRSISQAPELQRLLHITAFFQKKFYLADKSLRLTLLQKYLCIPPKDEGWTWVNNPIFEGCSSSLKYILEVFIEKFVSLIFHKYISNRTSFIDSESDTFLFFCGTKYSYLARQREKVDLQRGP